jgi:hypothetical protein
MGRPQIKIDKENFEKLCALQCTLVEISEFFGCSEDTVERWCKRQYKMLFADIYKKKSAVGRISLRRSQFKMAESNPALAIWLGKQYLNQVDRNEVHNDVAVVVVNDVPKSPSAAPTVGSTETSTDKKEQNETKTD